MTPLISVIVPVYNVEKYLEECLDSILAQTFKDIEIICIDDGSTDSSGKILDDCKEKDERIIVVHDTNHGAAHARNTGIGMARGRYVCFLDSDDYMEPDTLKNRYETAEKNNCDLVIDNMDKFDCQSGEKLDWAYTLNFALLPEKEVFNRHDIPDSIMDITFSTSNNKFCRLDMLRQKNIRFKEIRHAEDVFFGYMVLIEAERISVIPDINTHYRVNRPGSATTNVSPDRLLTIETYKDLYDVLYERGILDEIRRSFYSRFLSSLHYELNFIGRDPLRFEFRKLLMSDEYKYMKITEQPASVYRNKDDLNAVKELLLPVISVVTHEDSKEILLHQTYMNLDFIVTAPYQYTEGIQGAQGDFISVWNGKEEVDTEMYAKLIDSFIRGDIDARKALITEYSHTFLRFFVPREYYY